MRFSAAFAIAVLALFGAGHAVAQQSTSPSINAFEPGRIVSPVLVIDMDRMFRDSALGKRVLAEHELRAAALDAENIEAKAALEKEEQELTDLRDTTDATEFNVLAEAFDQRVREVQASQSAKNREMLALFSAEQDGFLRAAGPVLERLLRESEAIVILERPLVVASISQIDITDRAIALLDETIGSGEAAD